MARNPFSNYFQSGGSTRGAYQSPNLESRFSAGGGAVNNGMVSTAERALMTTGKPGWAYGGLGFDDDLGVAPAARGAMARFDSSFQVPGVKLPDFGKPNPNDKFTLLRTTKDKGIQGLLDMNRDLISRNGASAGRDIEDYTNLLAKNRAAAGGYNGQEQGYINDYFNGNAASQLDRTRNDYRNTAQGELDRTRTDLAGARQRYLDQTGGEINNAEKKLSGELGRYEADSRNTINQSLAELVKSRSNYRNAAMGDIGSLENDLAGQRDRYGNAARGQTDRFETDLNAQRGAYGAAARAETDKAAADLAAGRGAYGTAQRAAIDKEIADRAGMRTTYGAAARRATDYSIADADRQRKLNEAASGGNGASSYFNRQTVDVRNRANTELAGRLADREYADFGITRGEQAGLDSGLYRDERGDYGLIHGERQGLNTDLANRAGRDSATVHGERQSLNTDLANRAGRDTGMVYGERSRVGENYSNREANDARYGAGLNLDLGRDVQNRTGRNTELIHGERMNLRNADQAMDRADIAALHGEQGALNRDLGTMTRSDVAYVRDAQGRLLGTRANMDRALTADYLQPMQLRGQMAGQQSALTNDLIRANEANNFYGLDDGNPEAMYLPPAPRSNYRPQDYGFNRGGQPQNQPRYQPQGQPGRSQPNRTQRPAQSQSRPSAADQAYFEQTGVYPDQDPNLNEYLLDDLRAQTARVVSPARSSGPRNTAVADSYVRRGVNYRATERDRYGRPSNYQPDPNSTFNFQTGNRNDVSGGAFDPNFDFVNSDLYPEERQ